MREIGASDAESRFGQLLDIVEHGEEVMITRHGREVARLIPPRAPPDREAARAAVQRLRTRAEQQRLGRFEWSEWRSYRDEGRP